MRLIDADVLPYENMEISETSGEWCVRLSDIENAPAIDVVPTSSQFKRMAIQLGYEPVVRCKDCKWFYVSNTIICCEKHTGLALARADDFCSYGERRNDD